MDYERGFRKKIGKKRATRKRLRGLAAILSQQISVKDPYKAYAEACYLIEKELHQTITPDYPVAKFMAQLELLEEDLKRQKKELEKIRRFKHGRFA